MVTLRNYIFPPVKVVTPPTDPAIPLVLAKEHMQVEYTEDDGLITQYIRDAQALLERALNVAYTERTLLVRLQHDGCNVVRLPYGPVQTLDSITYKSCECPGVPEVPADTASYCIEGDYFKGQKGYYSIQYTTGLGTAIDPDDGYITALLQQIAWMYENRGDEKKPALNPNIQGISGAISRNSWI